MSTGYHLHPYLPSGAGKVQGAVQGAPLTLFGPSGQTILTPSSEHHAGLTARQRTAMVPIAIEECSSAPQPGARLDCSSQFKEPGDDTTMKTTCLVLLMSGIVPLIQGSNARAASSNSHAAYSAAARASYRTYSKQGQTAPGSTSQTTDDGSLPGSSAPQVIAAGSQLLGSVSNFDFGNVNIGSRAVLGVTLTNTGGDTVAISDVDVSGPGFDASGISEGTILDPGQSVRLTVTFSPSGNGNVSGYVRVISTAENPLTVINLSGAGGQSTSISISIVPANQTISVGDKLQFKAVDAQGNDITSSVLWTSSDPSIVEITPNGLANALADGPVTITATQ